MRSRLVGRAVAAAVLTGGCSLSGLVAAVILAHPAYAVTISDCEAGGGVAGAEKGVLTCIGGAFDGTPIHFE